ncbi:MAG: glycoside hydrolase family 18 protein [Oscillospiraceae bacterium]|nr:glycoside hydrolase family 18 protein [Oscillospiraceae bacterium]
MEKVIAFFMSVVLFFCGAVRGSTPQKAEKLRVTAYAVISSAEDAEHFDPSHLEDVTDLIIFGGAASFNKDEEVVLRDDFDEFIEIIKEKTAGYDIRLHLNIDCGDGSDNETIHKQAVKDKKLQNNIKAVLDRYEVAGVHFDYEFPMSWTSKIWFSEFLISLDRILGDEYMIGIATCPEYGRLLPSAIRIIDMVEVMCYDNWNEEGFHAPMENMQSDIQKMVSMTYTLAQMDVGLPFYGRPTTQEARWYDYKYYWDKLDDNGLAVEEGTGLIASFNTPALIYEKTKWAIDTGLGGVMVFHYACDLPGDHEASLFNAITRAKTDCSDPV